MAPQPFAKGLAHKSCPTRAIFSSKCVSENFACALLMNEKKWHCVRMSGEAQIEVASKWFSFTRAMIARHQRREIIAVCIGQSSPANELRMTFIRRWHLQPETHRHVKCISQFIKLFCDLIFYFFKLQEYLDYGIKNSKAVRWSAWSCKGTTNKTS